MRLLNARTVNIDISVGDEELSDLQELSMQVVREAVVVPLTHLRHCTNDNDGEFDGGVYNCQGRLVVRGIQKKMRYVNRSPEVLELDGPISEHSGTHLFGGMLQNNHFGHFLTESITRLWAAYALRESIDSIVFYLRTRESGISSPVRDFIAEMCPGINITVCRTPTKFERLIVSDQCIDARLLQACSHPMMIDALRNIRKYVKRPADDIYVSRAGLMGTEGGIIGEKIIEKNLSKEGYKIIRPETLSISAQADAYNSARRVIIAEGSALHFVALCADSRKSIFMIWRRGRNGVFVDQVKSFAGTNLIGANHINSLWVPRSAPEDLSVAQAELNFEELSHELISNGFISSAWKSPSQEEINLQLSEFRARRGDDYIRFSGFKNVM